MFLSALASLLTFSAAAEVAKNILVECDSVTGAVNRMALSANPSINWIIPSDGSQYGWVDAKYGWGLGRLKVNGKEFSWQTPVEKSAMTAVYKVGDISVVVAKNYDEVGNLLETYRFTNLGNTAARLSDIAVNTPFNDNYPDAKTCYEARCNAHIWDGGGGAYVFCTMMGGQPGGLGLVLKEGAVDSYEVSERSRKTGMSNFRGVISLNPRPAVLAPGQTYTFSWLLFPADDWTDFRAKALAQGSVMGDARDYVVESSNPT